MAATSKLKTCLNCGIDTKRLKLNRCINCYNWRRNNGGEDKPYWLYTPLDKLHCRNKYCQVSLAGRSRRLGGYCSGCYQYLKKHGTQRFSKYYRRYKFKPCKICGDDFDVLNKVKGRCTMCHYFLRRWGYERTQASIDYYKGRIEYCDNEECGKRVTVLEMQRNTGFCTACYSYYNDHGIMRPRELCLRQIPHEKCECGGEAKHAVCYEVPRYGRERKQKVAEIKFNLCDQCYKSETEYD